MVVPPLKFPQPIIDRLNAGQDHAYVHGFVTYDDGYLYHLWQRRIFWFCVTYDTSISANNSSMFKQCDEDEYH